MKVSTPKSLLENRGFGSLGPRSTLISANLTWKPCACIKLAGPPISLASFWFPCESRDTLKKHGPKQAPNSAQSHRLMARGFHTMSKIINPPWQQIPVLKVEAFLPSCKLWGLCQSSGVIRSSFQGGFRRFGSRKCSLGCRGPFTSAICFSSPKMNSPRQGGVRLISFNGQTSKNNEQTKPAKKNNSTTSQPKPSPWGKKKKKRPASRAAG